MWWSLTVGAFLFVIGGHAIACRLPIRTDRVVRFVVVGGVTGTTLIWIMGIRYGLFAPQTSAALLAYALACEIYIFLFTMTISSISANLLIKLSERELTITDINNVYDSGKMVAQRLHRLVSTGFLRDSESGVTVTKKGQRLTAALGLLRSFFRHA